MLLRDFLDPERALSFFMKFAVYLILAAVLLQFFWCTLRQSSPLAEFGLFCIFLLLSPLAYVIREWRRGGRPAHTARRGAERTPLLPQHEEVE